MYVDSLELHDYRSYSHTQIDLASGVNVFQGSNGQGKTNLVEAVEYLSTLASHRVAQDGPLVRHGATQAVVRGQIVAGVDDPRRVLLEIEINPGKSNRARLNKSALPKASSLLGMLRIVLFSPDDLAIVKGEPADRRRFLDELVIGRWPRMAGVKADYDKVVRQRNALLKTIAGKTGQPAVPDAQFTLEIWDEQLARFGAELLAARLDCLAELKDLAKESYLTIAPANNLANAKYKASFNYGQISGTAQLEQAFKEELVRIRPQELARATTLIGPHRDDLELTIGVLPAKGYASHGESWSLALALRLAAFQLLRADQIEPVLILDDVFAELDETRCLRLADEALKAEQVLVTTATPAVIPEKLAGKRFKVVSGQVEAETP